MPAVRHCAKRRDCVECSNLSKSGQVRRTHIILMVLFRRRKTTKTSLTFLGTVEEILCRKTGTEFDISWGQECYSESRFQFSPNSSRLSDLSKAKARRVSAHCSKKPYPWRALGLWLAHHLVPAFVIHSWFFARDSKKALKKLGWKGTPTDNHRLSLPQISTVDASRRSATGFRWVACPTKNWIQGIGVLHTSTDKKRAHFILSEKINEVRKFWTRGVF